MDAHSETNERQCTPQPTKDYFDSQVKVYDEFCKLFIANKILTAQLQELNY